MIFRFKAGRLRGELDMLNDIQRDVFIVICTWVKTQNTSIKAKTITELILREREVKQSTVKATIRVLVKKGYIRRAVTFERGASYTQLRSI